MFERICRENGILQRHTKPRSPTTTGKIERFHGSLRRELLDDCGPFESLAAAQRAVDAWVHAYNHSRPHQALKMATPFSVFRPVPGLEPPPEPATVEPQRVPLPPPRSHDEDFSIESQPVELDMVISPAGRLCLPGGKSDMKFPAALGGHPVTVWAGMHSIHVTLAGEVIRTRQSRLTVEDLAVLRLRGRPAGPEPSGSAAPRGAVPTGTAVEIDRIVNRDGEVTVAGQRLKLGVHLSGQQVTLRLDRYLAHVIADAHLVKTIPSPVSPEQASRLNGSRAATSPLPPARQGAIKLMRTIPADGITQVAGQRLRVGRAHAGKTVVVLAEDTVFRVLHNDIEISTHVRKTDKRITYLRATRRPRSEDVPNPST